MSHGWTESLPEDWQVIPLRHVAEVQNSNVDKKTYDDGIPVRLCNYTDVYYNEYVTDDMDLMEATATPSEVHKFSLRAGDVIITKDSESWDDIAIPACVPHDLPGVVCGYHLTMLRPQRGVMEGRFLLRALQAVGIREQFWTSANGVTRFGLTQDGIKSAVIPVPPPETQRAIADFLDRKTQAIDEVITQKEELLGLLADQRAALIHRAVTKGLDPDVEMEESGIDWVGLTPETWVRKRLRWTRGPMKGGTWGSDPDGVDDVACVRVADFDRATGTVDLNNPTYRAVQQSHRSGRMLQHGDLLLEKSGGGEKQPVGAVVAYLHQVDAVCSNFIARVTVAPGHHWSYLLYLHRVIYNLRLNTKAIKQTTGIQNLDLDAYFDEPVLVPPTQSEQQKIGEYCKSIVEAAALQEREIQTQVRLLREYRQALITSAVTGKLDIPDMEAADGT